MCVCVSVSLCVSPSLTLIPPCPLLHTRTGTSFQAAVNDFKVKYVGAFAELSECKAPEEEEQSLEHTGIFNDYCEMLDSLLTDNVISCKGKECVSHNVPLPTSPTSLV